MMKNCFIANGFGAFLLFAVLSPAKAAPAPPSGGSILGTVEGVISFCTKIDASSVSSYKKVDEFMIDGQSSKAIWQIRDSEAYESAYGQVTKTLKALPHNQALATCKAH